MSQGPDAGARWSALLDGIVSDGESVTRRRIRKAWDDAHDNSTAEVRAAFLLTMFWGYGNLFFGPHNTRLAIKSLDEKGWLRLAEVRSVARLNTCNGLELLSDLRVTGLRLSFETKILYAMTGTIPILDRHTRSWLRHYGATYVDELDDDVSRLNAYVEQCKRWTQQVNDRDGVLALDPCLVEYLMFWDAKRGRRRSVRQAPDWLSQTEPWR
jgi:hypothetical protein